MKVLSRTAREHFDELEAELIGVLNSNNIDTILSIPDFIIARYIIRHLESLKKLHDDNEKWHDDGGEADHYDNLDGDAATALASAGWGTDEDYGGDLSDGTHF